jgi:hypothetical protein
MAAMALAAVACGEATPQVQTANVGGEPAPPAVPYPEAPASWGAYHSLRFGLTVALPDLQAWKIDDHTRADLQAAEPGTRSSLTVREETEHELVNHKLCEERARALGLVSDKPLRLIEDVVTTGPEAFDTRVRVGIESRGPDGPLVGHVVAFGAYVRKCLFFHFSTEVPSTRDDATLSQRLALARVRALGGIKLDELGVVPREKDEGR